MTAIICDKCDKVVKTGEYVRYQKTPFITDPAGMGLGFDLCNACNNELRESFLINHAAYAIR